MINYFHEVIATVECIYLYTYYAFGNRYTCQVAATIKCISTYKLYKFRNKNLSYFTTSVKCSSTNSGNRISINFNRNTDFRISTTAKSRYSTCLTIRINRVRKFFQLFNILFGLAFRFTIGLKFGLPYCFAILRGYVIIA